VQARAGQYDRVLVVAAGYNDPTTGSVGLETAVEVMLATAHEQGVDHVIWLTYREDGDSASRLRAHNVLLREQAAVHPELVIADWAARSAAMPRSWFSGDGLHLGADAAKGMADLIADTIDELPPHLGAEYVPPGPCHITSTAAPHAPLPAAALPGGTIGRPVDATEPARRLNLVCTQ
jgi:lysophospholipase L1-like esterase